MHENKRSFEDIVDVFISRIQRTLFFDLLLPRHEISVPNLVAARKFLQCPFVRNVLVLDGSIFLMLDVAKPVFDGKWVAQDLLLVG